VSEEFEDTKGIIRIRKSKSTGNAMAKWKGEKRTTYTTQKTKDLETRTPLKTGRLISFLSH